MISEGENEKQRKASHAFCTKPARNDDPALSCLHPLASNILKKWLLSPNLPQDAPRSFHRRKMTSQRLPKGHKRAPTTFQKYLERVDTCSSHFKK